MFNPSPSPTISITIGNQQSSQKKTYLEKFLKFQLSTDDITLLPASVVQEIITVPDLDILSVPEMPESILGVYSYRSEMLWMVDLASMLDYFCSLPTANLTTMVVKFREQFLGLVVSGVNDLVEYDLEQFQPPSSELFSPQILPFLKGYFTEGNNQIVRVLNVEKIFNQ